MAGGTSCELRGFPPGHPLSAVAAGYPGSGNPGLRVIDPAVAAACWVRGDRLVADGHIAAWLAELRDRRTHGHGRAAAVKLADLMAHALLGYAVQAVYLSGCAPDLTPDNLWARWEDASIAGVAVQRPTAAVVAGHDDADHPGAVTVPDDDALDRWLAERVAALFTPLLGEIRARTRLGLRTLWGRVADVIYAQILRAAKDLGQSTAAAWRRAERLADAVSHAVPQMRFRPRPFPVTGLDRRGEPWSGIWPVFSTCCYLYKARPGQGYCNVCPFKDDRSRDWHWLREHPPAPTASGVPAGHRPQGAVAVVRAPAPGVAAARARRAARKP